MIKQICDRCGKEQHHGFWSNMKRTQMVTQGEHDLCSDCRRQLMNYIEALEEAFLAHPLVVIEGRDE